MHLDLSDLNNHKFIHSFNDTINPISICGGDIESINHFFLHCPKHCEARQTLFDNIQSIDQTLTRLLIYGDPKHSSNYNAFILNSAIEFISSSERFNGPLFNELEVLFFLSLNHFSYGFLKYFFLLFCFVFSFLYLYPRCL